MADLASSGVVVLDSWFVPQIGTPARKMTAKRVELTLSSMGSATNKILASALGFQTVFRCSPLVQDDNTDIYRAGPSYDGSMILVGSGTASTPLDITGDYVCIVEGEPAAS